jgi:hypothetical protein
MNNYNRKEGKVQKNLDASSFSQYLDGFQEVRPEDLLGAKGGRVRYIIETLDSNGKAAKKEYRLGGYLSFVDPQLRYARLFNPYAKQQWNFQLNPPGKRVRIFLCPRGTSDEISFLRRLLDMVDRGEVQIKKV